MSNNETYYINVGSLSSYTNLYNTLGNSISLLRKLVSENNIPNEIIWDLRFIERKRISIFALTYFISVAKNLRDYFNHPFKVIMNWDPYILSFLHDLNFIKISNYYKIFDWDEYIGGYTSGQFNPNSKLFFFDSPTSILDFASKVKLNKWKEMKREDIELKLSDKIENILLIKELDEDYNSYLIEMLISTTAELVVNTLLHGQEISFIGIQRTGKGISISLSDSGIGLIGGLGNLRKWAKKINLNDKFIDFEIENDIDALLNSSLLKENDVGLKSAIDNIINNLHGYVTMSTGFSELRWEEYNWNKSRDNYDYSNFHIKLQSAKKILGEEKKGYLDKKEYYKGYYETHNVKLRGTRISFEIPFEINYLRK